MDGWMDGWMDAGGMDGWMDGYGICMGWIWDGYGQDIGAYDLYGMDIDD